MLCRTNRRIIMITFQMDDLSLFWKYDAIFNAWFKTDEKVDEVMTH